MAEGRRGATPLASAGSAERRGVHQPALGPLRVQTTGETDRGRLADGGGEDLAIVAAGLDRLHGPVLLETSHRPEIAVDAEDAVDLRVLGALGELVDIGRGDAVFLRRDQREEGPAHDVAPLVVAMAHGRPERFLRDDFRQDDVVFRIGIGGAGGGQARGVGGIGVAGAGQILLFAFGVRINRDRLIGHVVRLEIVGEVHLGGGAGLDADRGAVELLGGGDAAVLAHHEALAVVVVHAGEIHLQIGIAREGPGAVAGKQVDLARGQRGEAGLAGGRHVFDLRRVAQDRGRDGLADRDVEARPVAVGIGSGEAHEAGVHAAVQHAAGLDVLERGRRSDARGQTGRHQRAEEYRFLHVYLFLSFRQRTAAKVPLWGLERYLGVAPRARVWSEGSKKVKRS
ncbi:hypothetical protein SDC9_41985 [bioreactor metagenome]|uniref:Uncharacterized protein n=1 Tax=bioreactor metagenome TaxID=1076179 RepID=A0A644VZS7_9ZZZZ